MIAHRRGRVIVIDEDGRRPIRLTKAFRKIAAGLDEAIAIARGDAEPTRLYGGGAGVPSDQPTI